MTPSREELGHKIANEAQIRTLASTQPVRILLQAPPLLAESLALQLTREQPGWAVALKPEQLKGRPSLLIWFQNQ